MPAEQRRRDDLSISLCELWTEKVSPQQRLRALRIAIPRDHAAGEKLPAHTLGDRVAWIVVEGEVDQDGEPLGPGSLIYPESLVARIAGCPTRTALAVARTEVRALAIRNDDFRELCEEDPELGEVLLESLDADPRAARPGHATATRQGGLRGGRDRARDRARDHRPAAGLARLQGSGSRRRSTLTPTRRTQPLERAGERPEPLRAGDRDRGRAGRAGSEPEIEIVPAPRRPTEPEIEIELRRW